MSQLGIGAMLGMLTDNSQTVDAVKYAIGKKIKSIKLDGDNLDITLDDDKILRMFDDGQSCCEHRYMTTPDNLDNYIGETIVDFELKNGPDAEGEYGECHDIQFLEVKTDKDVIQFSNHNEHNGYYGGFSIKAESMIIKNYLKY